MSVLLSLLALTGARAEEFVVDGIKYSTDSPSEGEVTITGYENIAGDIVIPSTVTYEGMEYAVTDIDSWSFSSCPELTSVEILAPLPYILSNFTDCPKLQAIHISEENPYLSSVDGVVYNKEQTTLLYVPEGLKTVSLPSSVTTIDGLAFSGCSILESIDVSEDNATFSSIDGMLCSKDQTELVCVPEGLKNVTVPDSVVKLPDFYTEKNLTSIEILGPITKIEPQMFSECTNLTSVKLPASVESIGPRAFQNCVNLTSIECESPSVEIGESAFSGCSSLTSLDFLPPVSSMGKAAFYKCTGLTTIQFKPSSTFIEIAPDAFGNCINLISIEIPASVQSINFNPAVDGGESYAYGGSFYGCSNLQSITVNEQNTSFSSIDGVLYDKDQTVLHRMLTKSSITDLVIPSSVTEIGLGAFYGCNKLTSVEIPSSVNSIKAYTFSGCTSLTSIKIPSLVTTIGEDAFRGCTGLTSIEIPSSVNAIEAYAFYECSNLASVKFEAPSSLTTIEGQAFNDCPNLQSMAVPPSVKEIGGLEAFDYFNLDTLVIPHSVETMANQQGSRTSRTTYIVLNSNEGVLRQIPGRNSIRSTFYSTSEILDNFTLGRSEKTLYTVSDARNTGGTLTLSLTGIADEVLQIRALEIGGQRVEANGSSAYTFEDVGEGTEFELVVYADILDTEYPIYQTITVKEGGVGVGDVKTAGAGLPEVPEVRGSLAEGRAWVRIPGDGGTTEWTLTATDGTAVAQGRAQADGNWQPLEGAQAAKGLYLLTVRCGQTAKTVKFMAR